MTRVTPASRVLEAIVRARVPASVGVVCIFQLAAITTSRMRAHHAGATVARQGRRGFGLGQTLEPLERALDGGAVHLEYWVPAEDLAEFNRNIHGLITVIAEFPGQGSTAQP